MKRKMILPIRCGVFVVQKQQQRSSIFYIYRSAKEP